MKLIVGLGNPGVQYEKTRHNMGFMVLEQFLKDMEPVKNTLWNDEPKFKSDIAQITFPLKTGGNEKVLLAKPKTHMNNSGMAVTLLAKYYKVKPADIWIVQDELDLPLGSMKIRLGGSSAGQKGVESVIGALGNDKFWRFRMGIGVSRNHDEMSKHVIHDASDYVLGQFSGGDVKRARELVKRGAHALKMALEDSLEAAMNRFNTK